MIANKNRRALRVDPTRTATLRKKFMREVNKRFLSLKSQIIQLIVIEDAFGLKLGSPLPPGLAVNTRFAFLPNEQKLQQFMEWLQAQVDSGIIGVSGGVEASAWTAVYIKEAYEKAFAKAFDIVRRPELASSPQFYAGTRAEFLRSAFSHPVSIEKVKLLAARNFNDLQGISRAMSQNISRELTNGLIQGLSPRDVARNINRQVDGIGRARALTMARTETIHAHAEGSLDAMEQLGVTEVGVAVEWSTADDPQVCPLCADMEGVVLPIEKAHGLFPRHPNCRCSPIPANVGEDTAGQKRTKAAIQKAIDSSIRSEIPKGRRGERTLTEQRQKITWPGADLEPTAAPKSILDD